MDEKSPKLIPIRSMKRKRFPQAGVFAALLILAGAIVWAVANGRGGQGAEPYHPLRADLEAVWTWSDPEFAGGAQLAQWTFRWDGSARLEEAKRLASGLGIPLSGPLSEGSGSIDVVASDSTYKLTLWIHSQQAAEQAADTDADGKTGEAAGKDTNKVADKDTNLSSAQAENALYDVVLLLDAPDHADKQAILSEVGSVEKAIEHEEIELRGGFTVKGTAAGDGAGAQIAKIASAKEAEAYKDGSTSSLTYFSDKLGSKVQSGEQPVNLQIAESVPKAGEAPELVIGVPLITGDYARQQE